MISYKELEKQLKRINFKSNGWGRTEVRELCNILMPDEEIEECVNGYYEAGFALLVATKNRLLLVDKKPLNYLTVEDMRFDMITDFDYSHRLIGAHLCINTGGAKTLKFTSYNQHRLRNLLTYVQNRMTEMKKVAHEQQEHQQEHLEKMNEQLHEYLLSAQQQSLEQQRAAQAQQQAVIQSPQALSQQSFTAQPSNPGRSLRSFADFEQLAAVSIGSPKSNVETPADAAVQPSAPSSDSAIKRIAMTPQQISLAAARRVVPVISAYSRLPLMSKRRRYPGNTAPGAV